MTTSNSDIAGTLNLEHLRGDTFIREWTFTLDSNPIDLSGSSAAMEIRTRAANGQGSLILRVSTETGEMTITGASDNKISVLIDASKMLFAAGTYEHGVVVTSAGGIVTGYLQGVFVLNANKANAEAGAA